MITKSRLQFEHYKNYPCSAGLNKHFLHFSDVAQNQLGFLGLSIITIEKNSYTSPCFVRFSSLPAAWLETYENENLALVDPIIQYGLSSTSRLLWGEEYLAQSPKFAKTARSFGFRSGICQSMRDVFGLCHFVILVSSAPLDEARMQSIEADVSHLMLRVKDVLEAFYFEIKSKKYKGLSDRELEVLRWAASGKTAAETAVILGLSERTINYHLSNCAEKLGVRSKAQALIRAVTLNLL